jgi:hypothetical protein
MARGFMVLCDCRIVHSFGDSLGLKVYMPMRQTSLLSLLLFFFVGAAVVRAQAVASAIGRQFSVAAGGMASLFQPEYVYDSWGCTQPCQSNSSWYPVATASNQPLLGTGAYVDVKFNRWVQIEAEGRWLRFHQYAGVNEDNYLIGPKVSIFQSGRATAYVKALGGYSKMVFGTGNGNGQFTALAFGGGLDWRLTKRISLRAADFEYQYWPAWGNSSLSPYGASMGIGYRIF